LESEIIGGHVVRAEILIELPPALELFQSRSYAKYASPRMKDLTATTSSRFDQCFKWFIYVFLKIVFMNCRTVFIYDCEKGRDEGLDYERNGTGLCD
jgi:hypothetical protein